MSSVVRPSRSLRRAGRSWSSVSGSNSGGRLVQHQHGGVAQERACESQSARLARGKAKATLSQGGVETLRQLGDEGPGEGPLDRLPHLLASGPRPSQAEVLQDRPVKQRGPLRHPGQPRSPGVGRDRIEERAIDKDAAAVGLQKAKQQVGRRRLARAARPHEGHGLPGRDREGEPVQRGAPLSIRDPHVLEGDTRRVHRWSFECGRGV